MNPDSNSISKMTAYSRASKFDMAEILNTSIMRSSKPMQTLILGDSLLRGQNRRFGDDKTVQCACLPGATVSTASRFVADVAVDKNVEVKETKTAFAWNAEQFRQTTQVILMVGSNDAANAANGEADFALAILF